LNELPPTVALLSDFGERDGYAGAMKGAVLSACPAARLVDVSHAIAPGDVRSGARMLAQVAPEFPRGVVFLAVIDPGVGTARRPIALAADGKHYVAPDNGLLGAVASRAQELRVHLLTVTGLWRPRPSPVFHGRDIFGPVAGFLAAGGDLDAVGPALDPGELVRLEDPVPRRQADALLGEVVAVDGFGNLLTNLPAPPGRDASVEIAGYVLPLRRAYGEVGEGELVALIGSNGMLEIACNRARAVDLVRGGEGLLVALRAQGDPA
jgi:S-adenosylmethionine hydrolase